MKAVLLMTACLILAVAAWGQDEGEYQKWMQTAGATVGSLQGSLKAKNGEAATADARNLDTVFNEVYGFWEKKKVDDAVEFARHARDGFQRIAEQAAAGQFDQASATFEETAANCGGCHGAHREKAPDGSFKIK